MGVMDTLMIFMGLGLVWFSLGEWLKRNGRQPGRVCSDWRPVFPRSALVRFVRPGLPLDVLSEMGGSEGFLENWIIWL